MQPISPAKCLSKFSLVWTLPHNLPQTTAAWFPNIFKTAKILPSEGSLGNTSFSLTLIQLTIILTPIATMIAKVADSRVPIRTYSANSRSSSSLKRAIPLAAMMKAIAVN